MIQYTLKDNTIDQYIPVTPTKPQAGYIAKEESQQMASTDYNFDGVNNVPETSTADTFGEIIHRQALASDVKDIPVNAANSATDYIGTVAYNVPYIVQDAFADFEMMDIQTNTITTLQSANIESLAIPLYPAADTNPRVVSIFNGLQVVRIPANVFNDTTQTPVLKKYGTYYVKISPKFIQATVVNILRRKQVAWQFVNPADAEGRRSAVVVGNPAFLGTPWQFENNPKQAGRLHGSVVEIWNASLTVKKQTKISVENQLGLDGTSGQALFVLTPDNVGYDPASQVIAPGDIIRVFPRETYFDPIYVEVDYTNKDQDLVAAVQFLKNDAARDTVQSTISIYDDNGITIDSQGNINGTVIQAYQISLQNNIEVRRKINI